MKLAKRERLSLILGGGFLCLFLFWQFAISPVKDRVRKLETKIIKRENDLEGVRRLQSQYLELRGKIEVVSEGLAARGKDFILFSFLERLAEESGVKDKLSKMDPKERIVNDFYKGVSVEIKLKGVTLEKLIQYLHKIENRGQFLSIDSLSIKPSPGRSETLEVTFKVSTLIPIQRLALSVRSP